MHAPPLEPGDESADHPVGEPPDDLLVYVSWAHDLAPLDSISKLAAYRLGIESILR